MSTFGAMLKRKRLERGFTLRRFSERLGIDPSNYSKIERGRAQAPDSLDVLERMADLLEIERGTPEWHEFHDLAFVSRKELPPDIAEDERLMGKLPAFFRTVRGEKPTEDQVRELLRILKEE